MRLALLLVPALLLTAGCSRGGGDSTASHALPPDEAARTLIDRNWMDRWPTSKEERLHVYRFTPSMGGGVYQDRTLFKGSFELFRFEVDGDRLVIELPETEQKVRTRYRIERVSGPEPFDLKLTLDDSPRGPSVYWGRSVETGDAMLGW